MCRTFTRDNAATIDLDNAVIAANVGDYNGDAADLEVAHTALDALAVALPEKPTMR